jgi:hypothetical protein
MEEGHENNREEEECHLPEDAVIMDRSPLGLKRVVKSYRR